MCSDIEYLDIFSFGNWKYDQQLESLKLSFPMSKNEKLLSKREPCVYQGRQSLHFKLFNVFVKMLFPKQMQGNYFVVN